MGPSSEVPTARVKKNLQNDFDDIAPVREEAKTPMGYEKPQKNHQDGVKDPNIGPYVTIDEGGEHNDAETDDGLPYF